MQDIASIRKRLERHGLGVALRHLDQAEAAFARKDWEAANSQVRSFAEALFEGVAAIRLRRPLRSGAARKALQEQGILGESEGKLIQGFMDFAGKRGSHAGLSDVDDALSRRILGMGIAMIGLSLLPEIVRVENVIASQLKAPGATRLPEDSELLTSCPTCGEDQFLDEAEVARDGEETVYRCKNGCQSIVVVGLPGDSPWPGRGYRVGSHVIRNARDLYLPVIGSGKSVVIPASRAALMKKHSGSTRA